MKGNRVFAFLRRKEASGTWAIILQETLNWLSTRHFTRWIIAVLFHLVTIMLTPQWLSTLSFLICAKARRVWPRLLKVWWPCPRFSQNIRRVTNIRTLWRTWYRSMQIKVRSNRSRRLQLLRFANNTINFCKRRCKITKTLVISQSASFLN